MENKDTVQLLIELILNNTRLNYDKNDLRIDDDTAIIQVVKILAKEKYQNRFQELQEKEVNQIESE